MALETLELLLLEACLPELRRLLSLARALLSVCAEDRSATLPRGTASRPTPEAPPRLPSPCPPWDEDGPGLPPTRLPPRLPPRPQCSVGTPSRLPVRLPGRLPGPWPSSGRSTPSSSGNKHAGGRGASERNPEALCVELPAPLPPLERDWAETAEQAADMLQRLTSASACSFTAVTCMSSLSSLLADPRPDSSARSASAWASAPGKYEGLRRLDNDIGRKRKRASHIQGLSK